MKIMKLFFCVGRGVIVRHHNRSMIKVEFRLNMNTALIFHYISDVEKDNKKQIQLQAF